jgi:serine/threonine protein kinase
LKSLPFHHNIVKIYDYRSNGKISYPLNSKEFIEKEGLLNNVPESIDFMIMEHCSNGDLLRTIKQSGPLPPPVSRYFIHEILNGLEHLHEVGKVAHLDLKLDNVLINS